MRLKKLILIVLIPLFAFGTDYAKKFGFEFMAGRTGVVNFKYHINSVYTINPGISFNLTSGDNNDYVVAGFHFGQQFFLKEINALDQFIFADVGLMIYDDVDVQFRIDAGYGLQYSFNERLACFGRLGLGMIISDNVNVSLSKSGAGLVFYLK